MHDVLKLTATEQVTQIRSGALKPSVLMAATLAHIDVVNPTLNAIVSLRSADVLMDAALAADAANPIGALHGLPIAVKDLADVAGLPTTSGSPALAHNIAQTSDLMVQRMQDAGAIIIGKTNTPAFGLGSHTTNPVFGPTQNAFLPGKSAGGSSGGAAVALASHMTALADGSDMMGSLRNPAGWNGVYGLRPTWGRIPSEPRGGDTFLHQLATNGPMARTPADLALLLDVQSGNDLRQPHGFTPDAIAAQLDVDISGRKLAWLGDWGGAFPMETGVMPACEQGLETWRRLGCDVDAVGPPFDASQLWDAWITLRSWAVSQGLSPLYAQPKSRVLLNQQAIWEIEHGMSLTLADVNRASLIRSRWFAAAVELLSDYDALILPTAQCFPFPIDWAWPTSIGGQDMDTYHRWMEVVVPASLIGLPALAVPLPDVAMGLQVVGRTGDDLGLLQLEQAWHKTLS